MVAEMNVLLGSLFLGTFCWLGIAGDVPIQPDFDAGKVRAERPQSNSAASAAPLCIALSREVELPWFPLLRLRGPLGPLLAQWPAALRCWPRGRWAPCQRKRLALLVLAEEGLVGLSAKHHEGQLRIAWPNEVAPRMERG